MEAVVEQQSDCESLTPAQREYRESMRISWQQMLDGDGMSIEELLAELGIVMPE